MNFRVFVPLCILMRYTVQSDQLSYDSKMRVTRSAASLDEIKFKMFIFFLGVSVLLVACCLCYRLSKSRRHPDSRYTSVSTRITLDGLSQQNSQCGSAVSTESRNVVASSNRELSVRLLDQEIRYVNFEKNYEINPRSLKIFNDSLGKGHFGEVRKGRLQKNGEQVIVAVKMSKKPNNLSEQELFRAELTVMCAIGKHPCILALIGGVTSDPNNKVKIVMEYVDGGDLLKSLKKSREFYLDLMIWNGQEKTHRYNVDNSFLGNHESFSTFDLLSFAFQIAKGMKYLARIPCVHRDLALRNILVASDGTIRIADFGLARRCRNRSYYRSQKPGTTDLPIFWTAPEALKDEKFTEKSDVWSFGICLFELFSLGDTPILNGKALCESDDIFPEPRFCPSSVYEHMKSCWNRNADFRPNFSSCVDFFRGHLKLCSEEGFKMVTRKIAAVTEEHVKLENWIQTDDSLCFGSVGV